MSENEKISKMSFRDELCFMLSWDRTTVPKLRGRITSNFLSGDYKLLAGSVRRKKAVIFIEI